MKVSINGRAHELAGPQTLADVRERFCPGADVAIVNSAQAADFSEPVRPGDQLYFCSSAAACGSADLEALITARQPAAITGALKKACVGIAGAGGLGSVVAENLARSGVGRLVIVDYDVVEPTNLNRQRFSLAQLGAPKVQALADNIRAFNPFVAVAPVQQRLTFENCGSVFQGCAIIAECLDSAAEKAAIVSGLLSRSRAKIVAASGLAGIAAGDLITERRVFKRLYVVGDACSDADEGAGLFASRVGIAASKQSHIIIRLLAGEVV